MTNCVFYCNLTRFRPYIFLTKTQDNESIGNQQLNWNIFRKLIQYYFWFWNQMSLRIWSVLSIVHDQWIQQWHNTILKINIYCKSWRKTININISDIKVSLKATWLYIWSILIAIIVNLQFHYEHKNCMF